MGFAPLEAGDAGQVCWFYQTSIIIIIILLYNLQQRYYIAGIESLKANTLQYYVQLDSAAASMFLNTCSIYNI